MLISLLLSIAQAEDTRSTIEFDGLDIQGELLKPTLTLVTQDSHSAECNDVDPASNDYVECQLNLSYYDIKSICDSLSSGNNNIVPALDELIAQSKQRHIVENTPEGNWVYQKHGNTYKIVASPNDKYNGTIVKSHKAIASISSLRAIQTYKSLTYQSYDFTAPKGIDTVGFHNPYDSDFQVWESCLTDGTVYSNKNLVTRINKGSFDFSLSLTVGSTEENFTAFAEEEDLSRWKWTDSNGVEHMPGERPFFEIQEVPNIIGECKSERHSLKTGTFTMNYAEDLDTCKKFKKGTIKLQRTPWAIEYVENDNFAWFSKEEYDRHMLGAEFDLNVLYSDFLWVEPLTDTITNGVSWNNDEMDYRLKECLKHDDHYWRQKRHFSVKENKYVTEYGGDEMCTDYHYKRTNNIPIDPQPGVTYAGTHLPRSESPYEFHVISPTMIIVKSSNLETNEVRYGIIYRNVVKTDKQKQIDNHYIRSTWDPKYREEYTQFVIDESNRSLFSRLATKM